jgi:hypothetical protein
VHSFEKFKLLGRALRFQGVHGHRVATVGAVLTCGAIILNLTPSAKTSKIGIPDVVAGQAAQAVMEERSEPAFVAQPEIAAPPAQLVQSAVAAEDVLPSPQTLAGPSLFSPVEASPSVASEFKPDRTPAEKPAIVGVWAPDTGTCSARDFRDGLLPTVINTEGAWAGETFCIFTKRTETASGWRVVAKCSTAHEQWTSHVRLTITDNRLVWTSQRGTQAYSRCAPDILMAQAR